MSTKTFAILGVAILIGGGGFANARADAARGQLLSQRWCVQCHGVLADQSSANAKAPPFSAIAAEPSATEYSLRTFLRTPHPSMPNFILQADDIADIVDYVMSLKTK